jgi:hypothetical protein
VRIHLHFRIHGHVRDVVRRVRRFAVTAFILLVLFGSVVAAKNIFLSQLRQEVRKTFRYGDLRLSYFPPAIVVENVSSLPAPPLFEARRVRVEVPFLSLLRNEKSVNVFLDQPRVRLRAGVAQGGGKPMELPASLPFSILRGLVENGMLTYEGEGGTFEAGGLKVLFTQSGDAFTLRAASEKSTFTSKPENLVVGGSLNIALAGRANEVRVQRLTLEGPDIALKAEGRLRDIQNPEVDLDTRFEIETAYAAALLDLPFRWKGKAGGQGKLIRRGGVLSFDSDINADGLVLSGVPMGRIRGRLEVAANKGGRVDVNIEKPGRLSESVSIAFRGERVDGEINGVSLDPLMSDIGIAWPVKSLAWGTFSLEKSRLRAQAEFRDQSLAREGDRFCFRGPVDVRYNLGSQDVEIMTPDLLSVFGRLEGRAALRVGGAIDAEIRGTVTDLKQAREFVSLILGEKLDFPEIRGAGFTDVHLSGRTADPEVTIKGTFEPGGFDLFNAAFAEGEAIISGQQFQGQFRVEDPDLKGEVRVAAGPVKTEVEIQKAEADVAKVFAALRIPVSLQGRAAGDFDVVETPASEDVRGAFSSPEVRAYGQSLKNVSGRLEWKDGTLAFPEIGFDLYGGRVRGRAMVGLTNRAFDADLQAETIDLALLAPGISGTLSLGLAGKGILGTDRLSGRFAIKDFFLPPVKVTQAAGEFGLEATKDELTADFRSAFAPGDNEVQGRFRFPLAENSLTGRLQGHWTNLDLLLPWTGAKGRLDFSAGMSGPRSAPHVAGTVTVQGPLLPLPRFAHALTDFSGTARVEDRRITVTEVKAKLGGGDIKGSGEVDLGPSGVETIDLTVDGNDMLLAPLERTRALVDGTARLIKDRRQFVLDGDLLVKRLTWRRELYERFGFSSQPYSPSSREPGFFDNLSLNLRLRATDNALMENSLGRVSGRFDLSVTGDINDPVLLGDIELLRGNVNFQDQSFRILKGRVSFFNPVSIEPYVEIRAEAYVKDYRVTMVLSGPASRLKPEFSSSPPMPPEDVLALLALGEAFKQTYAYDPERSNQLSTASLLSFQIADQAKKRAEGLFTLDRFRIDPFVSGTSAEMTARLTLGKKLSRNLLFIYSTNLATQREEIYRMEWEVSNDFSLVGLRNELGRVSFDLRFRKRF